MSELFGYSLIPGDEPGTLFLQLDNRHIALLKHADMEKIEAMVDKLNGRKKPNPRVRQFIALWCAGWKEVWGRPYVVSPQDGARVKAWIGDMELLPLIETAKKGWKSVEWEARYAGSIASFINHYNELNQTFNKNNQTIMPARKGGNF